MVDVVLVMGQKHLSEGTRPQNFGVAVDLIVLLQLLGALFFCRLESPLGFDPVARLGRKAISHFQFETIIL